LDPYGESGGYLWSRLGSHHSAHDHCGHSDGGGSGAVVTVAVATAVIDYLASRYLGSGATHAL